VVLQMGWLEVHIVFMKSSQDMVTSAAFPFYLISEEIHFIFLLFHLSVVKVFRYFLLDHLHVFDRLDCDIIPRRL
jgi:citrate lyase synthetase